MSRSKMVGFCTFILILFFIAGCATMPQNDSLYEKGANKASLSVASRLKFEDVPIPSGFRILDKESFAFQNDKTRVALLRYTGDKIADDVVAFYKEQMSLCNWSALNIIEYYTRVMNYENSNESCIVTIEPQGKRSLVTIAISPRSNPVKPEKVEKYQK